MDRPIIVGIDPGVNTGFACWNRDLRRLVEVETLKIHAAMFRVRELRDAGLLLRVEFEDARQRRWYGDADERQERSGAAVREGVGSVKRDSTIWEHFLADLGVEFKARPPIAGATKWSDDYFKRLTKWTGRTSKHARDAAALVYGK